jgi:hypothetical protein
VIKGRWAVAPPPGPAPPTAPVSIRDTTIQDPARPRQATQDQANIHTVISKRWFTKCFSDMYFVQLRIAARTLFGSGTLLVICEKLFTNVTVLKITIDKWFNVNTRG